VLRLIQAFGWLACVVYSTIPAFWLVIHTRIEYWRSPWQAAVFDHRAGWMALWVAMALFTMRWRDVALYRAWWMWMLAVGLFVVGIWLYRGSGVNFSREQLYGLSELKSGSAEQRMVTSGIRARVRHPVYLAHLCEILAWSVGTGLAVCYGLTAFAVVTGAVMIRKEDEELERRFGEEYRAYRERVPGLIPRVWRSGSSIVAT
jgi:protein-S-isoprenylcysteine O-methyltransferase Ste14